MAFIFLRVRLHDENIDAFNQVVQKELRLDQTPARTDLEAYVENIVAKIVSGPKHGREAKPAVTKNHEPS